MVGPIAYLRLVWDVWRAKRRRIYRLNIEAEIQSLKDRHGKGMLK